MTLQLADGLDVLRDALSIGEVMVLIEKTARWVSPETFRLLPVWYPEFSRKVHFYRANWSAPQLNTNRVTGNTVHKQEGNIRANEALTRALGLTKKQRPNWSCCHIWGGDDLSYQTHNEVVQDPRFYSCVANMVLLPSPLKAFTDSLIEVKTMLRVCAKHLYGWVCDHESLGDARALVERFDNWADYPESWPNTVRQSLPIGTMALTDQIRKNADRRRQQIIADLAKGGQHYPRDGVRATLQYWQNYTGKTLI